MNPLLPETPGLREISPQLLLLHGIPPARDESIPSPSDAPMPRETPRRPRLRLAFRRVTAGDRDGSYAVNRRRQSALISIGRLPSFASLSVSWRFWGDGLTVLAPTHLRACLNIFPGRAPPKARPF